MAGVTSMSTTKMAAAAAHATHFFFPSSIAAAARPQPPLSFPFEILPLLFGRRVRCFGLGEFVRGTP
jgi:hypothetical protein